MQRNGLSGDKGYPDYLVWFDEHTSLATAIERAVAYPELGKNPATHAVFSSDALGGEQGRIWWVMGGRADSQPFDLVRSLQPFNPVGYQLVLNNFVTVPQSTAPVLAVVGDTGILDYRLRSAGSINGEVKFRNYLLPSAGPAALRFEKTIGRASFVAEHGDITIEQVWAQWDPRFRAHALTWGWHAHGAGASGINGFGSNPFVYTDDFGVTWRSADGTPLALPLTYSTATATPGVTPYDHFRLGQNSGWLPRDLGFSPGGVPWMTLSSGAIGGHLDGWQATLFRWAASTWQAVALSNDMEGNGDAIGCGSVRDYFMCAYSELGTPGRLLVKVSRDDGQTWSTPVAVDDVGLAETGALQRINWVSIAQPADRYLDNAARLFVGYYRVGEPEGLFYKNRLRWVRVQIGPRADFNGDEVVNNSDLDYFEAAYAAADWRADFNDDGVVDELDRTDFAAAMASEDPGPSKSVPDVVGLTQAAATAAITDAGLVVGTVTQESSATVPEGSVVSQNPPAEAIVTSGSAVSLVVSSGPPISVPDVVGLTQAEASVAITNAGLVVGTVTYQASESVPAGSVVGQNPAAETIVASGSAVSLVVSSGQPVSVPNVVGLTQADATDELASVGLMLGAVVLQPSSTIAAGIVISQNPTAGIGVANGSAVNLVVSTGPVPVNVPNVVGLTQAAATTVITSAELVVGTVTQQSSVTVPAGNVISQNPIAATSVTVGSAVNLVVSTGPALIGVPNVVGLTQAAATTAITSAGLVVGAVTQQTSATVPAGSVISQDPTAGTNAAVGSAVSLVVSSGSSPASASVTPNSLAFGNRVLNIASPAQSVTIANTGATVLPIISIALTGSNPGQFSRSTNCPGQLSAGGSCTATVVFRPTSTGPKSANLTIALGGGATNRTVALTGTGVNISFSVSPTSLAFGNVARGTTSAARTVTVTNTGSVAFPIVSVTLAGTAPGQFTRTNNCPAQVSVGGTCTVSVRFRPTSAGSKSALLRVTPGGGAAAKTVTLSGTGT